MISTKTILSFLLVTASLSVNAQDLFIKKGLFSAYEPAVDVNEKIDSKNTIGGYPIIKLSQEFKILLIKISDSGSAAFQISVPLGRVTMIAERNRKHHMMLDITANLTQSSQLLGWVDEPCRREDFLWKRSIGGSLNDVNCVSINHVVNYGINTTGDFQQMFARIKNEGIEVSPTVIRTTFSRLAPNGRRLVYFVDLNPELYGIDRDVTIPWGSNGWHKAFVNRDPKRIEFLERLKKWATDVQDKLDAAFNKDMRAFEDIKSLDEYLTGVKKSEVVLGGTEPKMEDRLARLKSLYEKGLLTESQYNEQVKIILTSN